jgi:ribose transport system substrate-binding protein
VAKRKPILLSLVVALVASALAACGSNDGAASSKRPLIGLTMRFIAGNNWLTTLTKAAVLEGEKQGYDVRAVDAQGSAERQIQQMQTFINGGAKAIIVNAIEDRGVAAGINAAKRAGVPVIVVNDPVVPDLQKKVACNVFDDGFATSKLVGAETARVTASRYPTGSSVKLYVQALFPQELTTEKRENGFMAGWNGYFKQHPGIKTVRVPDSYGKAFPDATLTAMRNTLSANPDINVIFNETDLVMGAVNQALKDARLMKSDGSSKVIIAGFDGGMNVVREMATNPSSAVVATGLNQPPTQARYAVQEAIAAIKGKKTGLCEGTPPTRILPSVIVTPKNAKSFVNPDFEFAGTK